MAQIQTQTPHGGQNQLTQYAPREKIQIEFEVLNTHRKTAYLFNRQVVYEEKILARLGRPIGYKAIIRDGRLVAIVTTSYRLIPNEWVDYAVYKMAQSLGMEKKVATRLEYDTKYLALLRRPGEPLGIAVKNSIDQSWSLGLTPVYYTEKDTPILIKVRSKTGKKFTFQRKHTKNADINVLIEQARKVIEAGRWLIDALGKAGGILMTADHFKALEEAGIPKKYMPRLRPNLTAADAFKEAAEKIWNSDNEVGYKAELFGRLEDWLLVVTGL